MSTKMKRKILIFSIFLLILILVFAIYRLFFANLHPNELILYGNVDVRQVDIGFRVPGRVNCLYFEEGDHVSTGDLLADLEKSPYGSQVDQAKANVESIEANLANAQILLKRREELIDVTGVSQEDLDNARASVNQLNANLLAAQAALEVSRNNLEYTSVYAPNEGIILSRVREPGTAVRETDPVYTLSLTTPVWIRAYIDEPRLGSIYYGMDAKVYTDTQGEKSYHGKIGFISPIAEFTPKTVETTELRTDLVYRLRIYIDQPDQFLKQGMPVTVRLQKNKSAT